MNSIQSAMKRVMLRANLNDALDAYKSVADDPSEVLYRTSNVFIDRMADDSLISKHGLRQIMRRSPYWNEALDCIKITGQFTKEGDPYDINRMMNLIVHKVRDNMGVNDITLIDSAITWLSGFSFASEPHAIESLNRLAPHAYHKGKKFNRVFKDLCVAIGIEQDDKFWKMYAELSDMMNPKSIGETVFISINPGHFITMTNPKYTGRGHWVSCHAFNSTEYEYNGGCSGYARDDVSIIVFTTDEPESERQYNTKLYRQMFAYKPNNGLMVQSLMYCDASEHKDAMSKMFREIVQSQIAFCEGAPNMWETSSFDKTKWKLRDRAGFAGYSDWLMERNESSIKISLRVDKKDSAEDFEIGEAGRCCDCGRITSDGVFCSSCNDNGKVTCDDCGCLVNEDDVVEVRDRYGNLVYVCRDCLDANYFWCDICEEYEHTDHANWIESKGRDICDTCFEAYYTRCDECGDAIRKNDAIYVDDKYGNEVKLCECCAVNIVSVCDECGDSCLENDLEYVNDKDGNVLNVCHDCAKAIKAAADSEEEIA